MVRGKKKESRVRQTRDFLQSSSVSAYGLLDAALVSAAKVYV
jgi:hypothetical protein